MARRAQFSRPEPGFSLYEGRTRGKRPRYTYSDDEGDSDAVSARRSTRQSGVSTPAEPVGPTFTASGRQVKSRLGGAYGESMLSGQADATEHSDPNGVDQDGEDDQRLSVRGGSQRVAPRVKARPGKHIEGYNELDEMEDESDAPSSGNEWDSGADEEPEDPTDEDDEEDADVEMSDDDGVIAKEEASAVEDDRRSQSLMVSLRYSKLGSSPISANATNGTPVPEGDIANAISPTAPDERYQPAPAPSTPLPNNVSSHSLPVPGQKSNEYSKAPIDQLPIDVSLQANPISTGASQVSASVEETSDEPEAAEVGGLPNFRQYQYQPSS